MRRDGAKDARRGAGAGRGDAQRESAAPRSTERSRLARGRAVLEQADEVRRSEPAWSLDELRGRLVEVAGWHGGATYSAACDLVLDAQRRGEAAVWVTPRGRTFLPADVAATGIDLDALPIVRAATFRELALAVDVLARSNAFGLVVLDLGALEPTLGVLARLAGLARTAGNTIALLTEKPATAPSLGSFVSLRADTRFVRRRDGRFERELEVSRDRRRARGWRRIEVRRGPPGLS